MFLISKLKNVHFAHLVLFCVAENQLILFEMRNQLWPSHRQFFFRNMTPHLICFNYFQIKMSNLINGNWGFIIIIYLRL